MPQRYDQGMGAIPASIFDSLQDLPSSAFREDAPVLDCRVGGAVIAQVAIDRSDAKITIRNIRIDTCVVHSEWLCEEIAR